MQKAALLCRDAENHAAVAPNPAFTVVSQSKRRLT
jgi:hypothetical protein